MELDRYCREVESYLCRKNDGHLIRVVGPAFELVCDWGRLEIPLRIVFNAIDLTFDRYHAKRIKRRPLRIEFCEANVLDQFEEWQRAVGFSVTESGDGESDNVPLRKLSLAAHVDRVVALLTAWRAEAECSSTDDILTDQMVQELELVQTNAKTARGQARQRLLERLVGIDQELIMALRKVTDPSLHRRLRDEAQHDLEPFRGRMPTLAFQQAVNACTDRLLRDHYKLPRILFDS